MMQAILPPPAMPVLPRAASSHNAIVMVLAEQAVNRGSAATAELRRVPIVHRRPGGHFTKV